MAIVAIVPIVGIVAVLFAAWLAKDVLSRDTGTQAMQDIAGTIFEGAMAFLRRQYQTIAMLAIVTAVVIAIVVGIFETTDQVTRGVLAGVGFIAGAFCSAISGFIGMYIAVRANVRTAAAAQRSLRDAITVSLAGRRRFRLPRYGA